MLSQRMIDHLREFFSTQPVEKAWVFGSYARGEERPDSDVDIMVRYTSGTRLGLFGICALTEKIENVLQKSVDLVEEGTLYKRVRREVDTDKIMIYER